MTMLNFRVLLVEDHAMVRAGLRLLLTGQSGIEILGEAATVIEAMQQLRAAPFDLVLLDISLNGENGLDLLSAIRAEGLDVRVLVLSAYPASHYTSWAMANGACGFISKLSRPAEVIAAIRQAAHQVTGRYPRKQGLSPRESQILDGIAVGKTLTLMARELGVSVKTIGTYRARILDKLGLRSNTELVRFGFAYGTEPRLRACLDSRPLPITELTGTP
jgi:DNA-binding NarL/FixJ family response regulator